MTEQVLSESTGVEARGSARPAPSVEDGGGGAGGRAKWLILAAACLAQLMVVLDATVVNIALPTAQADLGFSNDNRQWIVTGYALAFGSLLLVGGRLGDLMGRRATFITGLAGFAGASVIGGAATSFEMLVAARAGQGVFGALLAPAALSLVTTTFADPRERNRAFAIYGVVAGGGGAFGLILGGALTEYLSWRWTLYVNVPLAVLALVSALALLPRTARDKTVTLDLPGSILSIAGLVNLVYGLANAETDGWTSPSTWGFVIAGLGLLAGFAIVEMRVADPLLPLGVLTDRNRGGAFIALALAGAGIFGVFLFLTYYLSTVLGYEPLSTGVAFLPLVAGLMIGAQIAPNIVERIGVKVPIAVGFLIAAAATLFLTRLDLDSTYATDVLPGLVAAGFGTGLIMAPSVSAATDRVDRRHTGVASAAVNAFHQLGGSVGTAVLSAAAASAAAGYLRGRNAADPLVLTQAGLESYHAAFLVSAFVFVGGAVISALLLRHGPLVRDPDAEPVLAH